jgi:hypothetical protein
MCLSIAYADLWLQETHRYTYAAVTELHPHLCIQDNYKQNTKNSSLELPQPIGAMWKK